MIKLVIFFGLLYLAVLFFIHRKQNTEEIENDEFSKKAVLAINYLRKNTRKSRELFEENIKLSNNPILTRNIVKDGQYIEGITIFSNGTVKKTNNEKEEYFQLSPHQFTEILNLVNGIKLNKPVCCEDYGIGSPASYLILHSTKEHIPTSGSCMTHTLLDVTNLEKFFQTLEKN
jgi:hypothetical protein